jgi:hypothetical protein
MQISSPLPGSAAAGPYPKMFAGSAADPSAPAKAATLADDPAVKELNDYANMTPAQKLRAAILGKMNMTEADLAKMDPKERKKIEDKIAQTIKQQIEHGDINHKGVLIDVMA